MVKIQGTIRLQALVFASLAFVSTVTASCGQSPSHHSSDLNSVEVPVTAVENQMNVGFCWAYSAVGLVESQFKAETGREVNLSEESIGFYRMAAAMHQLTQTKNGGELLALLLSPSEGAFIAESKDGVDALSILSTYGAVPESVWSYKFSDTGSAEKLTLALKAALLDRVWSKIRHFEDPSKITFEEIVENVMTARGAYPSAPPREFDFEGAHFTAQSFVKDFLHFDTTAWAQVYGDDASGYDRLVGALKQALARGISVPIGFPVNMARLNKAAFSGKGVDLNDAKNFFSDGAHAVLVTDFVNIGSKAGALSLESLRSELDKAPSDLDYLVLKNSWGFKVKRDDQGVITTGSESGYYTMDQEYLRGSNQAVMAQPDARPLFNVLVPRDIAADPLRKAVDINPKVAAAN